MSRQAKSRNSRGKPRGHGGGMLTGVMVGLLIGIVIAVAIALYINFGPKPFTVRGSTTSADSSSAGSASAPVVAIAPPVTPSEPISLPGKPGDAPVEKPKYDFYKILPGDNATAPAPAPTPPAPPPVTVDANERIYLQVGAFNNPAEADNLKARLAFMGLEASLQRVETDKGVVQRVRIGPYSTAQAADSVRARLATEGIDSTVQRSNSRAAASRSAAN